MDPQQIFKELMKSEKLQTHFGISKEELADASYVGDSNNTTIEIVKDVIKGIANRKSPNVVFQGILKKVSD